MKNYDSLSLLIAVTRIRIKNFIDNKIKRW